MSLRVRSIRLVSWALVSGGMSRAFTSASAASSRAMASSGERWAVRLASSCLAATSADSLATTRSCGSEVFSSAGARWGACFAAAGIGAADSRDRAIASSIARLAFEASVEPPSSAGVGSSSVADSAAWARGTPMAHASSNAANTRLGLSAQRKCLGGWEDPLRSPTVAAVASNSRVSAMKQNP